MITSPNRQVFRARGRIGSLDGATSTAHKLARVVYYLVRHGAAYVKQTEEAYADQVRWRVEKAFHRRAKELGYEVTEVQPPIPAEPAAPPLG